MADILKRTRIASNSSFNLTTQIATGNSSLLTLLKGFIFLLLKAVN